MRFYKLDLDDVIVFHDELDLAPGKVRVKTGGGVAGHNGLKSLTAHIGNDYVRVRIGIGHPGRKDMVHGPCAARFRQGGPCLARALLGAIAAEAPFLADGAATSSSRASAHALQAQDEAEGERLRRAPSRSVAAKRPQPDKKAEPPAPQARWPRNFAAGSAHDG